MNSQAGNLANLAAKNVFWSLAQAWLTRGSTLLLFVFLARVLTPEEYGLAMAAASVLLLLTMISELGYGDAIIQRASLAANEQSLPFVVSISLSVVLAIVAMLASSWIEATLAAPGLSPIILALSPIAPLSAISLFQEANYKKSLDYRWLALRVLVANLVSGPIAILAAYMGAGPWALVIQSYLTVLISSAWLWYRPKWQPSLPFDLGSFLTLTRFSLPVLSLRILDFSASRLVDALIIQRFGLATYGLYAVASRLYQVLNQLFQSAISDVSLSLLSRISQDTAKMQRAYQLSLCVSSLIGMPAFVCLASVSNQLSVVFGSQWQGLGTLALPLLLVGAIQAVQFLNGAYISARGKPKIILGVAAVKYVFIILGLLVSPQSDAAGLVQLYAVLQLIATPLSFFVVTRELKISGWAVIRTLVPAIIGCTVGYVCTVLAIADREASIISLAAGLATFSAVYIAVIFLFGRRELSTVVQFLRKSRVK